MTAVVFHGPPGSYKTFSCIQDVVIPALQAGRTVVTNIRGLDDIDRIEQALDIELPDEAQIISLPHSREGFHDIGCFFHWAPEGALIAMDEGQRVYATRLRSLSEFDLPDEEQYVGRPRTVEDAFDQHRHHNWDIYITTTNINKIHKEIRQICEYGYRHRDLSGFVPWWRNCWKVGKHDPSNAGTSESHMVTGYKRKKADVRYFKTYQSTATGVAKDSSENKSIFKNGKLLFYGFTIVACIIAFIALMDSILSRGERAAETALEVSPVLIEKTSQVGPVSTDNSDFSNAHQIAVSNQHLTVANKRQSAGHQLLSWDFIFVGSATMRRTIHVFTFTDPVTERGVTLTSDELRSLGINISVNRCIAYLSLDEVVKLATCQNPERYKSEDRFRPERSNASSGPKAILLRDRQHPKRGL